MPYCELTTTKSKVRKGENTYYGRYFTKIVILFRNCDLRNLYAVGIFTYNNEYATKENATNKDYLVALIKRMLVYPCLVFIGIMFVCVLLNIALLTIAQYIVS